MLNIYRRHHVFILDVDLAEKAPFIVLIHDGQVKDRWEKSQDVL